MVFSLFVLFDSVRGVGDGGVVFISDAGGDLGPLLGAELVM